MQQVCTRTEYKRMSLDDACALGIGRCPHASRRLSVDFGGRYARSFPTISSSLRSLVIHFVLVLSLRPLFAIWRFISRRRARCHSITLFTVMRTRLSVFRLCLQVYVCLTGAQGAYASCKRDSNMGQNSNQTVVHGEVAAVNGSNNQNMATGPGQAMDQGAVGQGAGVDP